MHRPLQDRQTSRCTGCVTMVAIFSTVVCLAALPATAQEDNTSRTDYLTFAQGALSIRIERTEGRGQPQTEEAMLMIDGNPVWKTPKGSSRSSNR